jgi:bifunctional UDP-N-acetylglucosamine pyrophosphorylase / glucosamine-1-phosphate N-acetyltransferase
MKSQVPKVLHALCGRSMLGHALATASELQPERLVVVAGYERELVAAEARRLVPDVTVVVQDRLAGTGNAVRMVTESLGTLPGIVVVTYADMPLLRAETLQALAREHDAKHNAVTVLTARVPDPTGYGRIVRDADGNLTEIVEQADATEQQRAIGEINSGCYAFDGVLLADAVKRIATDNAQGQEYLTDVVSILRGDGHPVGAIVAADAAEIQGVNDRVQLAQVRHAMNRRTLDGWMRSGVTVVDPETTWVDVTVTAGQDAEILPFTCLEGQTSIQENATVGPNCRLLDTLVGAGAAVSYTVAKQASIGPGASVGPFAYLRPDTEIGKDAHVGTYVELKKSTVGEGAKVPHLTYVGDADIGARANIGAGTIFANYDGVHKHHTTVGEAAFIGSDTVLVAPLTIGDGAYTAAGSAIDTDIPPGALGVARARQYNSPGWTERRRPGTRSAQAAARAQAAAGEATAGEVAAEEGTAPDKRAAPDKQDKGEQDA